MLRAACALAVAIFSLSGCASLGAREALVSDRPDFTDGDLLIARGVVQMEGGSTMTRTGPTRTVAHGEVMMRTGLTRRSELRLAANSYVTERTSASTAASTTVASVAGVEDASIGVKVRLHDQPSARSWQPAVAVLVQSTLPTGTQHFRSSRAQPEVKLITAWTLTDKLSVSSNVNVGHPFDGIRSHLQFAGSGSLGYAPSDRLGLYVEGYAVVPRDGSGIVSRYGDGGVFLLLTPDVQLDLRGGLALQAGSPDYFTGIGLTVRR